MSETTNESATIEAPAGAKKRLDPGFSRNMKIIGGVLGGALLLVIGVVIFAGGDDGSQTRKSRVELGSPTTTDAGQPSPAMQQMIADQQKAEAEAAARAGRTYIPPDTIGQTVPVAPVPVAQPLPQSTYQTAAVAVGVNQQAVAESDARRREGLERQLRALMDGAPNEAVARERIEADASETARPTAQRTASNGAPATNNGRVSPSDAETVIPGLEIVAAELASDLTVPANATVFASAIVNAGPARGAFLIGQARVIDEALEVTFKQMRLGDKVYPVDAIVLDQETAASAVAGSVDRRLLQRFVIPVALATAKGFFAAKAQTGSVAVAVGDAAAITTPPSTAEQARSAGISEGLDIAQQEVQRMAQKPIVVSAPKRTAVGILFRAPVTEEKAR